MDDTERLEHQLYRKVPEPMGRRQNQAGAVQSYSRHHGGHVPNPVLCC